LVPVVAEEICRLAEDASDEEAARARTQLKAGLLMGMESSASRVEQIARQQMVFDRVLPVDEIKARVDAVDAAALRRFAARITANAPALAAVGPLSGLETYDKIAARFT